MSATELAPTQPKETKPLSGLTPDEFMRLYSDEDYVELIRGEVVQLAPVGVTHNRIEDTVLSLMKAHASDNDLGEVWGGDAGFVLERDPHTVRSPDVAFVSNDRLEAIVDEDQFFPGAPDFAVEILSPTDSLRVTESKARMYLRAGGSVVWILDPNKKMLRIYHPDADPVVLGPDDEADAEPVLPGFRCPVRRLLSDA